jgi:hypothetical protein
MSDIVSGPMFRLRYSRQIYSLSATPQMTIAERMSGIQILTELFASRQEISWGYPPQQIPTDLTALARTVAGLGIKCREFFTVGERTASAT